MPLHRSVKPEAVNLLKVLCVVDSDQRRGGVRGHFIKVQPGTRGQSLSQVGTGLDHSNRLCG